MKIKSFASFVEDEMEPTMLRDATVVVDGINYFYRSYTDSGLTHALGCDSYRYAAYLREHLAMYKKANVKCYFVFKGGHKDVEKRLKKEDNNSYVCPIFIRNIYKEVLVEMGFEYVVCEYESKRDVIAMAQKLDCPIISHDIEFCFSGCQYIPYPGLKFNERNNTINCRYFALDKFLKRYNLSEEKIAIFIVITDINIFPGNYFLKLFQHLKAPSNCYQRNLHLLRWLAVQSGQQSVKTISRFVSAEDRKKFVDELEKAELMIGRQEAGGPGAARLLRRHAAADWFATGVVNNHVAIDYVNLYRSRIFFGSRAMIPLRCQDDSMFLSLRIVKYAYDLLTDFRNEGFIFVSDTKSGRKTMTIAKTHSIRKPDYEANVCVFENGWNGVRERGLFEHFLTESLENTGQRGVAGDAVLRGLARLPADARLLAAALLYFSRARRADSTAEAYAVLLSYVTLSIVYDNFDKNNLPEPPFAAKPILSPTTNKDDVTKADCNTAAAILADYAATSKREVDEILDPELLHPLVQFQHCLSELNDLNALCGAPLRPAALRRAVAGPLAYKLRRAMLGSDARQFVQELLRPAPTVLAFLTGLIDLYEEML